MLNYDVYANEYDSRYASEMCRRENIAIYEAISSIPNLVGKKVIDIGCGTGFFLDLCKKQFNCSSYLGIDVSEDMIKCAREKYPEGNFVVEDSRKIAEITRHFDFHPDFAISFFTIPYIGVETIESLYEILPVGGLFLMVYYNKPYLNPSSVYADKVEHYMREVQPKVDECITCVRALFEFEYEHILIDVPAYNIALCRKVR